MNEGTEDTEDLYNSGYQDDATGKNSARREMNIPTFNNGKREAARGSLKASEGAATKAGASKAASAAGGAAGAAAGAAAKAAEKVRGGNSGNGLFTGSGRDTNAKGGKGKGKFNFKKAAPLFAVLLLMIVSVGTLTFLGQAGMPFSLRAQIDSHPEDGGNKLSAVYNMRGGSELAYRLQSTDPKDTISAYMQGVFADFGFEYIEEANSDGTVARALIYKGNNENTLVASNTVKDKILESLKTTGATINNYREVASVPDGGDEIAAAWYGALNVVSAGAWYNDNAALAYERLGLNPGKFNTGNPNPSKEEILEAAQAGGASEKINAVSGTTQYKEYKCLYNEATKKYDDCKWRDEAFNGLKTEITTESTKEEVAEALQNRATLAAYSSVPDGNKSRAATSTAEIKADDSVITAVTAMVKNKTTNFADNIVSAIDQTKAGVDGGGVVMNYYANLLNTPAKSYDANGKEFSNIAATQSTSFNSWFSDNVHVDPNNAIVQKYNVALSMDQKGIDSTAISNELTGNYNNIDSTSNNSRSTENVSNSTDKNGDVYIYCKGSGTGCPTSYVNGDITVSADVAAYAYALTSIDLNATPSGEEAAVAFNEGIALLNDTQLSQVTGTYGSEESLKAFYQMSQQYLARAANYDRQTKSPFDTSSSNTFLGSIISSLLPFATAMRNNTLFSTVAATSTVFGNSISSLLPEVAATSIDEIDFLTAMGNNDSCAAYEAAGMACNATGNPQAIVETDYLNASEYPMSVIEQREKDWGYVTCDSNNENCKLNDKYKEDDYSAQQWIYYCTGNSSMVNNNITTETQTKSQNFFQAFFEALANLFRPSKDEVRNQIACGGNYGTEGQTYVTMRDGKKWLLSDVYKTHSMYSLDQSIKETMGEIDKSSVTAYLREYYKENPLDQSFEGIIARQSGLTVAEVKQAFASMEYAVYIARYNPAGRYQFTPHEETELDFALSQTDQDTMKTAAIVSKMHEFDELKNRNFAA